MINEGRFGGNMDFHRDESNNRMDKIMNFLLISILVLTILCLILKAFGYE